MAPAPGPATDAPARQRESGSAAASTNGREARGQRPPSRAAANPRAAPAGEPIRKVAGSLGPAPSTAKGGARARWRRRCWWPRGTRMWRRRPWRRVPRAGPRRRRQRPPSPPPAPSPGSAGTRSCFGVTPVAAARAAAPPLGEVLRSGRPMWPAAQGGRAGPRPRLPRWQRRGAAARPSRGLQPRVPPCLPRGGRGSP